MVGNKSCRDLYERLVGYFPQIHKTIIDNLREQTNHTIFMKLCLQKLTEQKEFSI